MPENLRIYVIDTGSGFEAFATQREQKARIREILETGEVTFVQPYDCQVPRNKKGFIKWFNHFKK